MFLACPKGFTSKARFACTPCLEGTYGFRCADNCQCQHSERLYWIFYLLLNSPFMNLHLEYQCADRFGTMHSQTDCTFCIILFGVLNNVSISFPIGRRETIKIIMNLAFKNR